MAKSDDYSARHLSVLEGLEAVRKRPGMYIGSTDSRGLMHCLWEVIDNSVDEAIAGFGQRIDIDVYPDGSVQVTDRGRGVPVDKEPRTGLSGVELVFTKLHAGGKFGGASYQASGGLHGVGASVVNALSSRLDVEVDRDGKTWTMSFRRGEPGQFKDSGEKSPDAPFEPFTKSSDLLSVGTVKKGVTGTRVRYWPDPQVFGRDGSFSLDDLLSRARQTAFLVPGLHLAIHDHRTDTTETHEFHFEGGLVEYAEFLAPDQSVAGPWRFVGEGTFTETVPVLDDLGHLEQRDVDRVCEVDVVVRWGTGYDTVMKSFVNIIQTPKGGSHQAGFDLGLMKAVRGEVEKTRDASRSETTSWTKTTSWRALPRLSPFVLRNPSSKAKQKRFWEPPPFEALSKTWWPRGLLTF